MNSISHLLPSTATPADVERVFSERPDIQKYFKMLQLDNSNKSRTRASLARRYSHDVVMALIPVRKGGRPLYVGSFDLLSAPVRSLLVSELGADIDAIKWTPETASAAADALVIHYDNPTSAAMALKGLRAGIAAKLGIQPIDMRAHPAIAATYREAITRAHNAKVSSATIKRVSDGIDVPDVYASTELVQSRARAFIAQPEATPQSAADLLVIFSARPGEAETLRIGEYGGVMGALKKKGREDVYQIVSAVGEDLAAQYLTAWKALPLAAKRAAMSQLAKLAGTWGLQRRDLRAIGAALAMRHELLEGRTHNAGQARASHAAALRHEPVRNAQAHYERVNDPVQSLAAELAELTPAQLLEVTEMLQRLRAPSSAVH